MKNFCLCLLLLVSTLAGAAPAPDPNTPLLEIANQVMVRDCLECPEYIGEMIGANPITLGEIKDKSDIIVESCHFTLVKPNVVLTASHCVRRWANPSNWANVAKGDCSKAYGFYFPATKNRPRKSARCEKILTPISMRSGVLQLEPDDVLIQLDQYLDRETATVDPTPITDSDDVIIWGMDGSTRSFQKRSCSRITGSLLTPRDNVLGTAYTTLACDGEVTQGWSGDGVFVDGRLKAVVSFGMSSTTYGSNLFGSNEVAVSQANCSLNFSPLRSSKCTSTIEEVNLALSDLYLSSIDLSPDWLADTQSLIKNRLSYLELEYAHGPKTSPHFSYTPVFLPKCFYKVLLPESGKLLAGVQFNLESFKARYVVFNPDTTVQGVSRRNENNPHASVGEFNIGLTFFWSDFKTTSEGIVISNEELHYEPQKYSLVPFCK